MRHLKRYIIIGLFTPTNESVWEHMKLLFFPMLIYSFYIISRFKKTCPCITSSLCLGILTGTLLIPVFFYAYTSVLGKNNFILDIGTFVLSTVIAFWLSRKLTHFCWLKYCTFLLCCLVYALFTCFIWFTYNPLKAQIFEELVSASSCSFGEICSSDSIQKPVREEKNF